MFRKENRRRVVISYRLSVFSSSGSILLPWDITNGHQEENVAAACCHHNRSGIHFASDCSHLPVCCYRFSDMKHRHTAVLFLLLFMLNSIGVHISASPLPYAETPHHLQLHGRVIISETSTSLEDALWLTEEVSAIDAERFLAVGLRSSAASPYRLYALTVAEAILSHSPVWVEPQSGELRADLVLPVGTAFVEMRTADGSLVSGSRIRWYSDTQMPAVSSITATPLFDNAHRQLLNWQSRGTVDGYSIWFSHDGSIWQLLKRQKHIGCVLDLSALPGGLLPEQAVEIRVLASTGLATAYSSIRIELPWQVPEVEIVGRYAGEILRYDRSESIDLLAFAWDLQERWAIVNRIIWTDEIGNVMFSGSDFTLAASRFPVGNYPLTAWSMNQQGLFGGISVNLQIVGSSELESPEDVMQSDDSAELFYQLRFVCDVAGWAIEYISDRSEIKINSYYSEFSLQENGDLWENGYYLGTLNLMNLDGKIYLSAEGLALLGFLTPQWNEESGVLMIIPR